VVAPWYWHDARPTRLETRLSPGERHNRGASAIRRSTRHLFQNHRCAKRRAGSLAASQGWRHSPPMNALLAQKHGCHCMIMGGQAPQLPAAHKNAVIGNLNLSFHSQLLLSPHS
jgi:hypothetical protein